LQAPEGADNIGSRGVSDFPPLRRSASVECVTMSLTVTVSVNLVPEGEYRISVPLAPSPGPAVPDGSQGHEDLRREDKVLPLGSSTLSPGLRLPLAP